MAWSELEGVSDDRVTKRQEFSRKQRFESMCLAVPMKLIEMTGEGTGRVDSGGVKTDVSLAMVPQAALGDYLIIHAGFAIEVLDNDEAHLRLELFRELAQATAELEEP